jgi:hypothetical protein
MGTILNKLSGGDISFAEFRSSPIERDFEPTMVSRSGFLSQEKQLLNPDPLQCKCYHSFTRLPGDCHVIFLFRMMAGPNPRKCQATKDQYPHGVLFSRAEECRNGFSESIWPFFGSFSGLNALSGFLNASEYLRSPVKKLMLLWLGDGAFGPFVWDASESTSGTPSGKSVQYGIVCACRIPVWDVL